MQCIQAYTCLHGHPVCARVHGLCAVVVVAGRLELPREEVDGVHVVALLLTELERGRVVHSAVDGAGLAWDEIIK